MGDFSRNTFNELNRYFSVRLQQGVPLVDADWNEMEDIRRFELRTFLKWFVGDGIPANPDGTPNDAFRIVARPARNNTNDFLISVSSNLNASRCLVDGMEVNITKEIAFTEQPLHELNVHGGTSNHPDVTPVDPNANKIADFSSLALPPDQESNVLVYLDVWEWEVDSKVDRNLENVAIGVPTCVRLKRAWVVRVREGKELPKSGNSDYLENHSYYALAKINYDPRNNAITEGNITDLRKTGLTVTRLLKVPVYLESGIDILDSVHLAELFSTLRSMFPYRLEAFLANIPTETETNIIRSAIQHLAQTCSIAEFQAKNNSLSLPDVFPMLVTIFKAQSEFLSTLSEHGNQVNLENFINEYQKLLKKMEISINRGNLVDLYLIQRDINYAFNMWFDDSVSPPEVNDIKLQKNMEGASFLWGLGKATSDILEQVISGVPEIKEDPPGFLYSLSKDKFIQIFEKNFLRPIIQSIKVISTEPFDRIDVGVFSREKFSEEEIKGLKNTSIHLFKGFKEIVVVQPVVPSNQAKQEIVNFIDYAINALS